MLVRAPDFSFGWYRLAIVGCPSRLLVGVHCSRCLSKAQYASLARMCQSACPTAVADVRLIAMSRRGVNARRPATPLVVDPLPDIPDELIRRSYAARFGTRYAAKGGHARAKKLSEKARRESARKAALARWARRKTRERS